MRITAMRFLLASVSAALCLTFPASGRALADQTQTGVSFMFSGVTRDHVFLTDDTTSKAVDVTGSLYTSQGQTYAVLNGNTIAIVLDTQRGAVYNTDGSAIGYIQRVQENPNEACASVCGLAR